MLRVSRTGPSVAKPFVGRWPALTSAGSAPNTGSPALIPALSQSSIFGAKSKNWVSEIQCLTNCQDPEKATLRQSLFFSIYYENHFCSKKDIQRASSPKECPWGAGYGIIRTSLSVAPSLHQSKDVCHVAPPARHRACT